MALKDADRKVAVQASRIGVTRGSGNRAVGQAIQSGNLTGAINSFLRTKTALLKEAEEAKGEMLGKQAELVYEDFTDEDGNTYQIATNYATPENLINTSWAATKFEEEAAANLFEGLLTGVSEIVENEKINMKSSINLKSSVGEINAQFRNRLKKPLEIIEENIPPELLSIYRKKKELIVLGAASELSNKHIRMTDTYNNATATSIMNKALTNMPTLSYTDPTRAMELYEETRDRLDYLSGHSSTQAQILIDTKLRSLEIIKDVGFGLQKFTTSDLSAGNIEEISLYSENLIELQKLFNEGPGSSVTVTNLKTGKPETINFESLGLSENDMMDYGEDLRQSFSRLSSLLQTKQTGAVKDARIIGLIDQSTNSPGGKYLEEKSDVKYVSQQIENPNTNISRHLMAEFNAEKPDANLTPFNFGDNKKVMNQYFTFVASQTGVVPDNYKNYIQANLNNNNTNERIIEGMVADARWQVVTNATVHPTNNTAIVTDVLSTMGLDEKAEKKAIALRRSVELYGVKDGVLDFTEKMRQTKGELIELRKIADDKGYGSIIKFRDEVRKKIETAYADTIFTVRHDVMVSNIFVKSVADDVLRTMQYSDNITIEDAVSSALVKIEKGNNYGLSSFSIGSVMNTAGDDIELDSDQQSFIRFPPDAYLTTEEQMNIIEEKLKSVNKQQLLIIDNRFIDEELELGTNTFLQVIGNPSSADTVQYRFVFANNDGTNQRILFDENGNTITVGIQELMSARGEGG